MLNILRSFAVTCTALFIIVGSILAYYLNIELEKNFLLNAHNNNRTLAWNIANAATPLLPPIFEEADNYIDSPSLILNTPMVRRLDAAITREDRQGTPVHEINVRDLKGKVVYSTSAYLLSKHRLDDSFKAAVMGEEVTVHRPINKNTPEGKRDIRDYFITYLPILVNQSHPPIGVISVQTDHSAHRKAIERQKASMRFNIFAGLAAFYFIFLLCLCVVRRRHNREKQELKEIQQELIHSTRHDPLTGKPNRIMFIEKIEYLASFCARVPHESFAVLLMDLDNFKVVNESLGHQSGNKLLKQVAERLQKCLSEDHLLARLGGDEFGIIVENAQSITHVINIAKCAHGELSQPFILKGREVTQSISIGITICQGKQLNAEDVIRDAGIAMYRAKSLGRSHYELFNPHMYTEAVRRTELEADIRRGIDAKEFFNRYQPIVDLKTGMTHSVEALTRWVHPTQKETTPDVFIPMAEETGLIQQIDQLALKAAVGELAKWRQTIPEVPSLSVNVNLSARNFNSLSDISSIATTLQRSGIKGESLKIELTESSILKSELMDQSTLEGLRQQGIHLCMDDFGTGYSSLSYLHKLNFDMLKIDMSLVQDITDSEETRKIVHTIIDMGQHLGIAVTAEGVETQEQLDLLRSMGCRYAQGYYFAKPLRADEVVPFILRQLDNTDPTHLTPRPD